MQQHPINERLSFLLKSFQLSARAFSETIGEKPTITQNYVGTRNSMPGADYLEKVMMRFESINPNWLLTGKGKPFLPGSPNEGATVEKIKKNLQSPIVGTNHGSINYSLSQCEKERDSYKALFEKAQAEMELLRGQLVRADALVAAKDQTIDLLKAAFTRPN